LIGGVCLAAVLVELGGGQIQLGPETVVLTRQLRDASFLLAQLALELGQLVTSLLALARLVFQPVSNEIRQQDAAYCYTRSVVSVSVCVCVCAPYHRCKSVCYVFFLFWSRFLRFFSVFFYFPQVFLFVENVGKVQSGEQINKKNFIQ